MRRKTVRAIAALSLAGMLALAACSDEAVADLDEAADASVADEVEKNAVELVTRSNRR